MGDNQTEQNERALLVPDREELDRYLEDTAVVDWQTPAVYAKARALSAPGTSPEARIRAAFEFVRDAIADALGADALGADALGAGGLGPEPAEPAADQAVAFTASQVLRAEAGLSPARCHLLAALLRAQGIPAGFGYQRLADPGCRSGFALHGFAAAWLDGEARWLPLDPAGQGENGAPAFALAPPHFARVPDAAAGEHQFTTLYARPPRPVAEPLDRAESLARLRPYLPSDLPTDLPSDLPTDLP